MICWYFPKIAKASSVSLFTFDLWGLKKEQIFKIYVLRLELYLNFF